MIVKGQDGALKRLLYEVHYLRGYAVIDKVGRFIDLLLAQSDTWVVESLGENSVLLNLLNDIRLTIATRFFSIDLRAPHKPGVLDEEAVSDFRQEATRLSNLLQKYFGFGELSTATVRIWHLFSFAALDKAERWISDLAKLNDSEANAAAAFKAETKSSNITWVLNRADERIRVALHAVRNDPIIDTGDGAQRRLDNSPLSEFTDRNEAAKESHRKRSRLIADERFGALLDVEMTSKDMKELIPAEFIARSLDGVAEGMERMS